MDDSKTDTRQDSRKRIRVQDSSSVRHPADSCKNMSKKPLYLQSSGQKLTWFAARWFGFLGFLHKRDVNLPQNPKRHTPVPNHHFTTFLIQGLQPKTIESMYIWVCTPPRDHQEKTHGDQGIPISLHLTLLLGGGPDTQSILWM